MWISFYIFFILIFTINGVCYIIKYFWSINLIKNYFFNYTDNQKKFSVAVLCAAYNEQKNILGFIEDLENLESSYCFYIITSANETPDKHNKTTQSLINAHSLKNNFFHLDYVGHEQSKSKQLNFALDYFKENNLKFDLVLCLDTDSRVSKGLPMALKEVYEEGITAYQQPILWYKNYKEYDNSLNSYILKAFCHLQSYHSLAYEIPMIQSYPFDFRLKYLIGNGMCIKYTELLAVGGFPSIIDDTRLGKILDYRNKSFKIIPSFGVVESAKSISVLIKQMGVWFFGCNFIIQDLKDSKQRISLKILTKIAYAYAKQIRWFATGPVFVFLFIYSITNLKFLYLFFIVFLLNYFIPTFLMCRGFSRILDSQNKTYLGKVSLAESTGISLLSFAHIWISSASMFQGLCNYLSYNLRGYIKLYKTER